MRTVSRLHVIGDGVIGLAVAVVAAARRCDVTLFAASLPGAASPASAGMLAPSVERTERPGQAFSDAARDAWPRLLQVVRSLGDPGFDLRQQGILQVALTEQDALRIQHSLRGLDRWLSPHDARRLEPELTARLAGAAHFVHDGLADVPSVLASLRRVVQRHHAITVVPAPVRRVEARGARLLLTDATGARHEADHGVLAAGAWSPTIAGLPRALPVAPLRGSLVAVAAPLVRAPVYAADGHSYVLPRGGGTVVGATSDDVGFDARTGAHDIANLLAAAATLIPALGVATATDHWTGLRPMTPDRLPILGPDPALPALLYACGHSRNGFLHAALSAEVIVDLVLGAARADIAPFSVERFTPHPSA